MSAIRHAVLSDKGRRHKTNEDRVYASAEDGLYFVTDGMANEVTPHFIQETLPGLIADRFAKVKDFEAILPRLPGCKPQPLRFQREDSQPAPRPFGQQ